MTPRALKDVILTRSQHQYYPLPSKASTPPPTNPLCKPAGFNLAGHLCNEHNLGADETEFSPPGSRCEANPTRVAMQKSPRGAASTYRNVHWDQLAQHSRCQLLFPNLKYRQDWSAGISSYVCARGILFIENVF